MPPERVAFLRRWHERAYQESVNVKDQRVAYLGLDLVVPAGVFVPTPTSDLLGRAVMAEVQPGMRVLDMGTGSGVNAILAARGGADVVGVDINPDAVAAAQANAERNGVVGEFAVSDVFTAVAGRFDLVVIDPPFRWFAPRDMAEAATADEGTPGWDGSSPGSASGCGQEVGFCCSSVHQGIRTTSSGWLGPPGSRWQSWRAASW